MNDQIIDAQQDRPLNFFAKGGPRFFQHPLIRSREVYEIIAMNQNRRDLCHSASLAKEQHIWHRKRFCHPAARIAREKLNRFAPYIFRYDQGVMHTTLDGCMESDLWFAKLHGFNGKHRSNSELCTLCFA